MGDIRENGRYCGRFLFIPSLAAHFCGTGRMKCTVDASHCDSVGNKSYDTIFEALGYDVNNHLISLTFASLVGLESLQTWLTVFNSFKRTRGFDVSDRATIAHQKKAYYLQENYGVR